MTMIPTDNDLFYAIIAPDFMLKLDLNIETILIHSDCRGFHVENKNTGTKRIYKTLY